jgi:hypothetical protein
MRDSKTIIIFILSILCVMLSFFAFKKIETIIDTARIEIIIDSLNTVNKRLLDDIELRNIENKKYSRTNDSLVVKNDSLQKLKSKNKDKIGMYENFKSPNYIASADTMRSIFTENNIE